MAEFNPGKFGSICWYELTTRSVDAAKDFYTDLFGWKLEPSKLATGIYDEIHVDGCAVGGMMKIDENWGPGWENIPSYWMTYISVEDCDATVETIKANHGDIRVPAFDVPNIGRMAVCNDPSGAAFSIIQFVSPEE